MADKTTINADIKRRGLKDASDVAKALLEQETVGPEVLEEILGPLPRRAPVVPPPQPTTVAPSAPV